MSRSSLPLEMVTSNSDGLGRVPDDPGALERDAGFIIFGNRTAEQFRIIATGPLFPPARNWDATIKLSTFDLFAAVQECRAAWQAKVVLYAPVVTDARGGQVRSAPPFQREHHRAVDAGELRRIGAQLALAGSELFDYIFASGDATLERIGNALRKASAQKSLLITVHSRSFYVPWGMLYTHPSTTEALAEDGSNFSWEGFWAYRHVLEQVPPKLDLDPRLGLDADGRLLAGIVVNDDIDGAAVTLQLDFFGGQPRLRTQVRRSRDDLRAALRAQDYADRILYFFCHGIGAGDAHAPRLEDGQLILTSNKAVTVRDLVRWLRRRNFTSHPVVFINACQGGQITTMFYRTVADELLRRGAVALVGAQVDVPVVFAHAYAKAFFTRFLDETQPTRMGPLVRELARQFIDEHGNPLGLIYSLYRGADCHIAWSDA